MSPVSPPSQDVLGWRDEQLPDGTVILTSPGDTYVTTPGSALLFPSLCQPTADLGILQASPDDRCGDRTAMMPKRRRTRAQNRAHRIAEERQQNQNDRLARRAQRVDYFAQPPPDSDDDEPPPF